MRSTHLSTTGEAFGQKPRELAPWQVVAIGGLAGALASIATTPADVVKTRIMTASASQAVSSGARWVDVARCAGSAPLAMSSCMRLQWRYPPHMSCSMHTSPTH